MKHLEAKDFDQNAEKIYRGVMQLKALGLQGSVAEQYSNKYYTLLQSLAEPRSAFRMDSSHSASVSATFYALQAIVRTHVLARTDDDTDPWFALIPGRV